MIELDEIIRNGSDTAHFIYSFFSYIVINLKIPQYTKCGTLRKYRKIYKNL